MNKISTRSPFAHLCLWRSLCVNFPNSYREHNTRTERALYHSVTLNRSTMPLTHTHTNISTRGPGPRFDHRAAPALAVQFVVCCCGGFQSVSVFAQQAVRAEEPRFTYLTSIFIATGNT